MIIQDDRGLVSAVGRLVAGVIGESRRSTHLFDLDAQAAEGDFVVARCGAVLPLSDIEWLRRGAGMPCERCLGFGDMVSTAPLRHEPAGA